MSRSKSGSFSHRQNNESQEEQAEVEAQLRSKGVRAVLKGLQKALKWVLVVDQRIMQLFSMVIDVGMARPEREIKEACHAVVQASSALMRHYEHLARRAKDMVIRDHREVDPLARMDACRTMKAFHSAVMVSWFTPALTSCMRDEDPLVRTEACTVVVAMMKMDAQHVEQEGLLQRLQDTLGDSNAAVAASALRCIQDLRLIGHPFELTRTMHGNFLSIMNEVRDEDKFAILKELQRSKLDDVDAHAAVERVAPLLNSNNASVVLVTLGTLGTLLGMVEGEAAWRVRVQKRMADPILKLVAGYNVPQDIKYTTLRLARVLMQRCPFVLEDTHAPLLFLKHDEKLYLKLQKLDLLQVLISERNYREVLAELEEYAVDVDDDVQRKAIQIIGTSAVMLPSCGERFVTALIGLISQQQRSASGGFLPAAPSGHQASAPQLHHRSRLQECLVYMAHVFRAYPGRYDEMLPLVCDALHNDFSDPSAKAAFIWILGEFSDRIEGMAEQLAEYVEDYEECNPEVQNALLVATSKAYLRAVASSDKEALQQVHPVLQNVLHAANRTKTPDVRQRALFYASLLRCGNEFAAKVVLAERPPLEEDLAVVDGEEMLSAVIADLPNLAGLHWTAPEAMFPMQDTSLPRLSSSQGLQPAVQELLDEAAAAPPASLSSPSDSGTMELPAGSNSLTTSRTPSPEEVPGRPVHDSINSSANGLPPSLGKVVSGGNTELAESAAAAAAPPLISLLDDLTLAPPQEDSTLTRLPQATAAGVTVPRIATAEPPAPWLPSAASSSPHLAWASAPNGAVSAHLHPAAAGQLPPAMGAPTAGSSALPSVMNNPVFQPASAAAPYASASALPPQQPYLQQPQLFHPQQQLHSQPHPQLGMSMPAGTVAGWNPHASVPAGAVALQSQHSGIGMGMASAAPAADFAALAPVAATTGSEGAARRIQDLDQEGFQRLRCVVPASSGRGVEVMATLAGRRSRGDLAYLLEIRNMLQPGTAPISEAHVRMAPNKLGLHPVQERLQLRGPLHAGSSQRLAVPLDCGLLYEEGSSSVLRVTMALVPLGLVPFEDFIPTDLQF